MDFPLIDCLNEEACFVRLLNLLHPDGLACPRCGERQHIGVHRCHRAPVLDYQCAACGRVFNAWTGTILQGTQHRPGALLMILHGIAQATPMAQMARELGCDRKHLLEPRHRLQDNALMILDRNPLGDAVVEADEADVNAGKKGIPHADPTDPPRRRANGRRGHGTFTNDRPPVAGVVGRESGEVRYDRIGRGHVPIPNPCISILGGMQPGPLRSLVRRVARGDEADDGLISRFQLLVWPDPPASWRNVDRWPDTAAKTQVFAIFQALDTLTPSDIGAKPGDDDGPPFLRFDPEAQELFEAWRAALEAKVRVPDESPLIESHLAKYRSLMPSLAELFHLIAVVDGAGPGPVSIEAAGLAVAWCDQMEAHARRIYAFASEPDLEAARALANQIKAGALPSPFQARDAYRKGWARLDTPEAVRRAGNAGRPGLGPRHRGPGALGEALGRTSTSIPNCLAGPTRMRNCPQPGTRHNRQKPPLSPQAPFCRCCRVPLGRHLLNRARKPDQAPEGEDDGDTAPLRLPARLVDADRPNRPGRSRDPVPRAGAGSTRGTRPPALVALPLPR